MKEQDYILKKYVRAESASKALQLDSETEVSEVFLVADKPAESSASAVGFTASPANDGVPYEARRR